MNKLNIAGNALIIAIIIIITVILDHKFFMSQQGTIEVKPPVVSETVHNSSNPNCDTLKKWYTSPLQMSSKMVKQDILRVDVWDDGKSAYADFPIKSYPTINKHIIQVGYLFQYHDRFFGSYSAVYLHNFGRIAIGGGAIGSNQSLGIQAVAQVNF